MAGFAVAQGTGNENWQAQLLAAHPGENAAPVPFFDAVKRSFDDTVKTRNSEAVRNNYGRRVNAIDDQYKAVTGKNMPAYGYTFGDASNRTDVLDDIPDADFDRWVLEQRAADPRLAFLRTTGELRNDVTAELMPVRQAAAAAAVQHPVGSFIGGLGGSLMDLDNNLMMVGTAPVGIEGTGLKMIATRIGLQGAVGAGSMAVLAPGKMSDAQRFGGPAYTSADAAGDIAGGALGGAAIEAVGIAGAKLGGYLWGTHIAPRLATGAGVDPVVRGAIRKLEMSDIDEQAAGGAAMPGERDHAVHALSIGDPAPVIETEKNLDDLFENSANAVPNYQNVASAYHSLSPGQNTVMTATEYQGRKIWSGQFDPMTLDTDAVNFQYKADGDREGVTARLQGVQSWDPASSGKSLIFENAEGRQFVADGHQRRGLARRLVEQGFEEKPMLDGYLFREADGWSARDVRIVAALKNMREGSGTILDAAKVFRDAPGSAADRSLPVTGDFIQQARALAKLEPEAFGAVVNKVIPERYAAEIGQVAGHRPDMHMAMVRLMKEAEPASIDEARALVSEALLDEQIASEGIQADLFGGIAPQMTTIARAKVKASVLGQLRRDARIYTQLVKNADIIEAGGNALARTENERRLSLDLAAAEIVNRLSLRSGPVGEAFADAARKVAEGARAGDVSKGITASVKKAIADGEIEALSREINLTPEAPPPPIEIDPKAQIEAKPEDVQLEAGLRKPTPVAQLTGTEVFPDENPADAGGLKVLREKAWEWFRANLVDKPIFSTALDRPVIFTRDKFKKMRATTADPDKLRVIAAIPETLNRGVVEAQPSYAVEQGVRQYLHVSGDVELAGKPVGVRVVVREMTDGSYYYDHLLDKAAEAHSLPLERGGGASATGDAALNIVDEAAEVNQPGLFDDLLSDRNLQDEPFDRALIRLGPCAPGGE
jgi:hypothetical protein